MMGLRELDGNAKSKSGVIVYEDKRGGLKLCSVRCKEREAVRNEESVTSGLGPCMDDGVDDTE